MTAAYLSGTIALTNYVDLHYLRYINTHLDNQPWTKKYITNWIFRTTWLNHAWTPCLIVRCQPLNVFERIVVIQTAHFEEGPMEVYFWEQSTVSSPWIINWTDAAGESRGFEISDSVFGQHWTRYVGVHSWFTCTLEELCDCEGWNCAGTHSTVSHAAAAATTSKFGGIALIVAVPPTVTHSEIDVDNWQW